MKIFKIAILASGRGSNAMALTDHIFKNRDRYQLMAIISNNRGARVLELAKSRGLPTFFISEELKLIKLLQKLDVNWTLLAGYMQILSSNFLKNFEDKRKYRYRVLNIHPSLLPKYRGLNGYKRAYQSRDRVIGSTVHFVNEELDSGEIVLQESFQLLEYEKWSLSRVVDVGLKLEHKLYPKALDLVYEEEKLLCV